MKTATVTLAQFLATARQAALADLYTFTLATGVVFRCTGADVPVTDAAGLVYQPLGITRGGTVLKRGVDVDTLNITFTPRSTDLVNGTPLLAFVTGGGFDGARLVLQRAYFDRWGGTLQGTLIMFSGRVAEIREVGRTYAKMLVNSWLDRMNANVPPNVYAPGCWHTLFDAGCGLSRASYVAPGQVTAAGSTLQFTTGLTAINGYYDLGTIVFTSGPNVGLPRTIKHQTGGGVVSLALAFPTVPAVGDSFVAYPGCDRTLTTCRDKFNNLLHFGGTPFVPVAETSV